jgi:hypothetical protein
MGGSRNSPNAVIAPGPLVLALTVCYQTQLITAGLRCLPVSCYPPWVRQLIGAGELRYKPEKVNDLYLPT